MFGVPMRKVTGVFRAAGNGEYSHDYLPRRFKHARALAAIGLDWTGSACGATVCHGCSGGCNRQSAEAKGCFQMQPEDAPVTGPSVVTGMSVTVLRGLPMFQEGMSVAREIAKAALHVGFNVNDGDVVVIAQKIVSKVEGRRVRLSDVEAGAEAEGLAQRTGRPAALMQLMRDESAEIMRATPQVTITRQRTGHVAANAGIDASNIEGGEDDAVLLWPRDADASARAIRAELRAASGAAPAVLIADSLGRAWRMGTIGTAIGCAGLQVLHDRCGEADLFGRALRATLVGVADSIAAAAVLAMGEGAEGTPVAVVRGVQRYVTREDGSGAVTALRPLDQDLFR